MRNEEIYKLIATQSETIDAKLTGFKAEIKAGVDLQTYKLDQLIEYQEKQNNRIGTLEKDTRVFRLIHRNPKASFTIGVLSLIGLIAIFVIKNLLN